MKRKIFWAGLCTLSLLVFALLWCSGQNRISELTPQRAAEFWETEEKPYAMASVFLPEQSAVPQDRIGEIYVSVENALAEGGVSTHPWYYAASYQTDAVLTNGNISCSVELTAVSGEFFRIHPMELLDGWYFSDEDLMHDRIVLEKQTAWNLFYTTDVVGQYLTLNGTTYQVAAVVEYETGKYNELAAGDVCRAWVPADSPGLLPAGFTCMEMVLPQPVKGFAVSTVENTLSEWIPESVKVTDNSGRFSLPNRWKILRSLTTRGISSSAIAYPYWENAAQLTENSLALRLLPECILLLFPVVSGIIVLVLLRRRKKWRRIRFLCGRRKGTHESKAGDRELREVPERAKHDSLAYQEER